MHAMKIPARILQCLQDDRAQHKHKHKHKHKHTHTHQICSNLDQCMDETTFGHADFGPKGSGTMLRLMGKKVHSARTSVGTESRHAPTDMSGMLLLERMGKRGYM
jgi:hypothetical protein